LPAAALQPQQQSQQQQQRAAQPAHLAAHHPQSHPSRESPLPASRSRIQILPNGTAVVMTTLPDGTVQQVTPTTQQQQQQPQQFTSSSASPSVAQTAPSLRASRRNTPLSFAAASGMPVATAAAPAQLLIQPSSQPQQLPSQQSAAFLPKVGRS
jgi:hypothetical protein